MWTLIFVTLVYSLIFLVPTLYLNYLLYKQVNKYFRNRAIKKRRAALKIIKNG